ncbi:hypothetical protein BUALT_Bualt01G0085400 [Buddleja alternifolia]|uniref:Uncharacterized protein n=1 Tax=Buddleja alternifolia TaxID=168488 RepID=A0AAV6YG00_9LAMI|nr:hypothetical protein BUALT_Bualt01G0085400 [Buddleja alternifolia]
MGELVVSSEGGMEIEAIGRQAEDGGGSAAATAAEEEAAAAAGTSSPSVVRWERFLPKMAVRVLLVEADDSTRQIISALLRKCSYRGDFYLHCNKDDFNFSLSEAVAAVCDGLKAWEILKGGNHNIDLILTEVELPSISGYALLTLIMEHDVCKNIPVIMMSSNDSVSTVYKCMLRGAADFLVKPLRKNELRNLWQHVWRRQTMMQSSSGAGPGPPHESEAQQNVEATAENNGISNHSSGYMACVQRNRECIEKGSDAQSSCTKPELENEGADIEHIHCLSQPANNNRCSHDIDIPTQEKCHQESRKIRAHDNVAGESRAVASLDANHATTRGEDEKYDDASEQVHVCGQNPENNDVLGNSSREAIDLIGAFDNYLKGNFGSSASNACTNRFDILPQLDLSLRRSHHLSGSVNQVNDETRRLKHSDASAFSRYIYKPLQPCNPASPSNQQKEHETNSEKQFSNHTTDYYSDAHGQTITSHKHNSMATIQPARPEMKQFISHTPDYNSDTHGQTPTSHKHISVTTVQPAPPKFTFPYPQQGELSHPIPVRYENVINGYGSLVPRINCTQSSPSLGPANQSEPFPQLNLFYPSDVRASSSHQFHNLMDPMVRNAVDQTDNKQGQKTENLDWGNISSTNDQSGNSSFYTGSVSHYQSNEEGFNVKDGASNRSSQREAALNKFRLKRKGRCFEKKVRYESRKKLAEQRPRVKGQFVRQATNDPQPENPLSG